MAEILDKGEPIHPDPGHSPSRCSILKAFESCKALNCQGIEKGYCVNKPIGTLLTVPMKKISNTEQNTKNDTVAESSRG